MRANLTLLETRVARRMLGLFLVCAVLPILLLVVVAYRHVSGQLNQQSRDRLREASRVAGSAIVERLQLIDAEVKMATVTLGSIAELEAAVPDELVEPGSRVTALAVERPGEVTFWITGPNRLELPLLHPVEEEHLLHGGAIITVADSAGSRTVFMARMLDPERPKRGVLWAVINPAILWGPFTSGDSPLELCVFRGNGTTALACADQEIPGLAQKLAVSPAIGDLQWSRNGENFFAGYWTASLDERWLASPWLIVLSEPRAQVMAPMSRFTRTFVILMLGALVAIFLISNDQIRRGMKPLVSLQEGTLRVARGEFFNPVRVSSGDEFQHLAESFNTMADRLGRQFTTLTHINEIGRAALSQIKTEPMVDTVLSRFRQILPAAKGTVVLRAADSRDQWCATTIEEGVTASREIQLEPGAMSLLRSEDHLLLPAKQGGFLVLGALLDHDPLSPVLLLPLTHEGELTGLIALVFPPASPVAPEVTTQARQLADQAAVALANTRLMERLERLSWGTLSALARTIDAHSPWTAGHSERVTRISLAIGKELGLTSRELDMLHRGGLLHDIGKIGIPPRLLEKPARLTEQEMEIVRSHPVVGARILAPISVFRDIIPIVRHHHERFDGEGYPDRLAGESIPLLARVVAVADVYDALVSKRPYRPGWTQKAAVAHVARTASSHHDPVIVDAFMRLIARGELDDATPLPDSGEWPTFDREAAG